MPKLTLKKSGRKAVFTPSKKPKLRVKPRPSTSDYRKTA